MKKAQGLPINTVILAVLGIIVLIILILLIRTQLQKGSQKYTDISGTAEQEAKSKNICETMFALRSRSCSNPSGGCPQGYTPLPGSWADCVSPKGTTCCEAP